MPDGSVYVVRRPAADSGGGFVEMDFVLPAACVPPPPHVHRQQVEEYEVLEGQFDVVVDGQWTPLGPGEVAWCPWGRFTPFETAPEQSCASVTGTVPLCALRTSSSAPPRP
jgi:mannose-6-phosphate isomerase-like protein (cupin superfamily)